MNEPLADAEFLTLLEWLQQRTGLTFRHDQHANTRLVVDRIIKQLQVAVPNEVPSALLRRPEMLSALVNELTVGETYFFRESRHFDLLREQIIPDVRQRRGLQHRVRCWSAACASGEEIYSIAMTFDQMNLSRHVDLLATDLSEAAIARARAATYRSWSLRGDEAQAARSYLNEQGQQFHLDERIRSMVTFRQHNLAADDYPSLTRGISDMDVIFCRNVLIYFSRETIRLIAGRMWRTLAAGGWLITASADPPLTEFADFEVNSTAYGLVYRKPLVGAAARNRASTSFANRASAAKLSANDSLSVESVIERDRPPPAEKAPSAITSVAATASNRRVEQDAEIAEVAVTSSGSDSSLDLASNLAAAVATLEAGDPEQAAELTRRFDQDPTACVIHGRALAAIDSAAALEFCLAASRRHPLKEELHYLAAIQLADANRNLEALQSLQKVLFLDRSSILAHFLFGSLQRQLGQWKSARRHFQNVCELCATGKPQDVPRWSSGETLSDLATDAQYQLDRLSSRSIE